MLTARDATVSEGLAQMTENLHAMFEEKMLATLNRFPAGHVRPGVHAPGGV